MTAWQAAGRREEGTAALRAMPGGAGTWRRSPGLGVRAGIIEVGMVTGLVDRSHAEDGRARARHGFGAGLTGAAAQPLPAPLPHGADPDGSLTPEEQLRTVVARLARGLDRAAAAGTDSGPLGRVLVFRPWPARALDVGGQSPPAAAFRRLIAARALP